MDLRAKQRRERNKDKTPQKKDVKHGGNRDGKLFVARIPEQPCLPEEWASILIILNFRGDWDTISRRQVCGSFLLPVAVVCLAIFDFFDPFFSVRASFFGAFFFSCALCVPFAGA